MFRNQYLIVGGKREFTIQGSEPKCFKDLKIFTISPLLFTSAKGIAAEVGIIGIALNPLDPQMSNEEIALHLANNCSTSQTFWREISGLSGRYVLLYANSTEVLITGDPCHLRQIYYGLLGENQIVTSSVKMFLNTFELEPEISAEKKAFINLSEFKREEFAWFGNRTIDNRLFKLLPNHYLDLLTMTAARIPFAKLEKNLTEQKVLEHTSSILKGTFDTLIFRKYQIFQPLTAGRDTRALLAASRNKKDQIRYYVFERPDNLLSADIAVPRQLSKSLDIEFRVLKPGPLTPDFESKYKCEFVLPRIQANTTNVQYHYQNHRDNSFINITGNGAGVAKCFYGFTEGNVSIDMLLTFSRYGKRSNFITKELEKWLIDAAPYSKCLNIPLLDLFYWEQRMGNWGARMPYELDMAIEEISPFNNRQLFFYLLTIDPAQRCPPNYIFFHKLISFMWPETLQQPINPNERLIKKLLKRNAKIRYYTLKGKQMIYRLTR